MTLEGFLKIKVFDNLGPQVRYEAEHPPGYRIDTRIDVEGPATIMIFIGDMETPLRTDKL